MELDPTFIGGINNPSFFSHLNGWFFHGFCRRHKLSYTRIAGASRKIPYNWKALAENIIARVARSQTSRKEGHIVIPAVTDDKVVNTDHIPMYRDMSGTYLWTKKGAGGGSKKDLRGQVATGRASR